MTQGLLSLSMWADYPWFGVGAGNWNTFQPLYEAHSLGQTQAYGPYIQSPLSDWLRVLSERGIIGLSFYMCFFVGAFIQALRNFSQPHKDPGIAGATLVMIVIMSVDMCFINRFRRPEMTALTAILLGSLSSICDNSKADRPHDDRSKALSTATRFLILGLAIFSTSVFLAQNIAASKIWFRKDLSSQRQFVLWWPYPYHFVSLIRSAIYEERCDEFSEELDWAISVEPYRGELLELKEMRQSSD